MNLYQSSMRFKGLKRLQGKFRKTNTENLRVVKYVTPEHTGKIHKNEFNRKFDIRSLFKPYIIVSILLILIVIGSAIYFYVKRDKYILKNISTIGIVRIDKSKMDELLNRNIGQNIFLTFPSQIEAEIYKDFYLVKEVKVEKKFPDSLLVDISEKKIKYFVGNEKNTSIWDEESKLIKKDDGNIEALSSDAIKILAGAYNLDEVPISPELALQKNEALLSKDEKQKVKKLDNIDKNIASYRINKLKEVYTNTYKEIKDKYVIPLRSKNTFQLDEVFVSGNFEEEDIKTVIQKLNTFKSSFDTNSINIDAIIFNDRKRMLILSDNKFIKLESSIDMEKEAKALKAILDNLKSTNSNYTEITITGDKAVVI